jgi:hypothetical protein
MARLTQVERSQWQQVVPDKLRPQKRMVRSVAEYIAFATLASRMARTPRTKFIKGGDYWRL